MSGIGRGQGTGFSPGQNVQQSPETFPNPNARAQNQTSLRAPSPTPQPSPSWKSPQPMGFAIAAVPEADLDRVLSEFRERMGDWLRPVQHGPAIAGPREQAAQKIAAIPSLFFEGPAYALSVKGYTAGVVSVGPVPGVQAMVVHGLVTGPFVMHAGAELMGYAATLAEPAHGGRLALAPRRDMLGFYEHLGFQPPSTGPYWTLDPRSAAGWRFQDNQWGWAGSASITSPRP
jgi:hypothetical protein